MRTTLSNINSVQKINSQKPSQSFALNVRAFAPEREFLEVIALGLCNRLQGFISQNRYLQQNKSGIWPLVPMPAPDDRQIETPAKAGDEGKEPYFFAIRRSAKPVQRQREKWP